MHHSQQTAQIGLFYCLSSSFFSSCLVCKNQKVSVTNVMIQCPERQMVQNFGVLRSDAVYVGGPKSSRPRP